MNIFLLGYMGSGKSLIGELLSKKLQENFIDMDALLEQRENMTITTTFEKKGEIYFRKQESELLNELISNTTNAVIALGGGTPCYANNMERIKNAEESKSIYLKAGLKLLTNRLFEEKEKRPLIRHLVKKELLEEFLGKHLFERSFYYNQSDLVVPVNGKSPETIVDEIIEKLK